MKGARRAFALAAGIMVLAALPYIAAGVSPNFIHFDDNSYIYENLQVRQGLTWETVRWALTSTECANWHPLTWLSHLLDVTLFGLDARGHHASSILLHALNAGLLFLALLRLTGAPGRSAFVAALFGVHPLRVESVAWVAERKDVLAGLFFMLVLLAWERYVRRGGTGRYLTALALFALGLAAKPMLVTLPFLLLLFDFWPLGRTPLLSAGGAGRPRMRDVLLEKVPFFLLAAASGVITVVAQRAGNALQDLQAVAPGARLANAIVSYGAYLAAAVWPVRLAVYYPYPATIPWPMIAASTLLLAILSLAALSRLRTAPFLATGWCWFLGTLLPVIGLVQVGNQARADRYTYVPLIGVFLGATWLAAASSRQVRRLFAASAGAGVLVLAVLSARQAGYWKDGETLFSHTLAVTKDNWVIRNNLGSTLAALGRHQEALVHYRETLRLMPANAKAHYNLGSSLAALGRYEEAVVSYRAALQLDRSHADACFNLGNSLAALGRHAEALGYFREALRLKPDQADAYDNLGCSLAALGRHQEAIESYRAALQLNRSLIGANSNLGDSLVALGRLEEAVVSYRESVRLQPGLHQVWCNLGVVLNVLGRREEALASLNEALRLRPDYQVARAARASILSGSVAH